MGPRKPCECNGNEPNSTDATANSHYECFDQDMLEAIAVVGLSLKFPQDATSAESLWNMLIEGRCAMREIPEDRWNILSFYHPDRERKDSVCVLL